MFQGTIPAELRSIVAQHARTWPDHDIYVGCSGNLTIERTLHGLNQGFRLHSNDVNPYSCALGWHYSGAPVPFTVKDESRAELGWLHDDGYLDDSAGTLATLMLGTRFLAFVGKNLPYHRRMVAAYHDQFPRMHAETVDKLGKVTLQLATFYAGDVRDYLRDIPPDAPVLSFPPFWSAGYVQMFRGITDHFNWPEPEFEEITDDDKHQIIEAICDRPRWLLGFHFELPELEPFRVGYVKTGPRAMPIWVYARPGITRWVGPRQKTEPVLMPRIGPNDQVSGDLTLHPLTPAQFNTLRSAYLNRGIAPGSPLFACAVACGGRVIGAFGFLPPKYGLDAYLMSDFAVSPTRYKRLSKLVVMAATSSEAQQLVQRSLSKRVTTWSTTAFTNNPNSSKYGRGIPGVSLRSRKPCDDGVHTYQLQYGGQLGAWTLADALELWHAKHGRVIR